ncbi:TatD family hydrolase [Candidatus Pacearchaeota archaeon]|nr:TatD family hydrolase [Candidatus Pacearchaeota archaeon]
MKPCFIDVHCHLEMCEDISKCIRNAEKKDVGIILTQGTSIETNRKALELAEKYDDVKVCLGIYPIDSLKMSDDEIKNELDFIRKNADKIVAIGEVGMDFKEDEKSWRRQEEIFGKFVKLSIELDKPIIVHSRKAEEKVIEVLEDEKAKKVIMHCFCGKKRLVERIVKNNWYLTIPTNVTYSTQFQDNAAAVPLNQLFCETDSPFLHPDKNVKEWKNEPGNVIESYKKIAEIKGMKLEEVEKKIYENYEKLFS